RRMLDTGVSIHDQAEIAPEAVEGLVGRRQMKLARQHDDSLAGAPIARTILLQRLGSHALRVTADHLAQIVFVRAVEPPQDGASAERAWTWVETCGDIIPRRHGP